MFGGERTSVFLIAATTALGACHLAIGIDDYSQQTTTTPTTSVTGAGGSGGLGGEGGVGGEGGCVAAMPVGWNGIVVLYRGTEEPPPCDAGGVWTVGPDGGTGMTDTTCTCGCELTTDASEITEACNRPFSITTGANCGTALVTVNSDTCADLGGQTTLAASTPDSSPKDDVCGTPVATFPKASFVERAGLCVSTLPLGSAELCDADPPPGYGAALCIYQDTETGCPIDFPERYRFFGTLTDNRMCGCSCDADALNCDYDLHVWNSGGCPPPLPKVPPTNTYATDGTCITGLSGLQRLEVENTGISGACVDSPTITGNDPAHASPYTVCCAEPR